MLLLLLLYTTQSHPHMCLYMKYAVVDKSEKRWFLRRESIGADGGKDSLGLGK